MKKVRNYISEIRATGLKSGDFHHDLDRVTLFTGPAASGKTARLDCLRLALRRGTILGRNREIKETTSAVLDLARNGKLTAEAKDKNGAANSGTWSAKGKPIVLEQIPAIPDCLLDHAEYFSLTPAKQIEYVVGKFDLNAAPEFSGEAVCAAVRNIRLAGEHTVETVDMVNKLVTDVDAWDTERNETGVTVQAWLPDLIELLKNSLKASKVESDRMTKTVQGITALGASAPTPRNPVKEIEIERAKVEAVSGRLGAVNRRITEVAEMRGVKYAIEQRIASGQGQADGERIKADIARITDEIEQLSAIPEQADTGAADQKRIEALQAENIGYQTQTQALTEAHNRALNTLSKIDFQIEVNEKSIEELKVNFRAVQLQDACPHCGTSGDIWKPAFTVKYNETLKALSEKLSSLKTQSAEADKICGARELERDKSREADAAIAANVNEIIAIQRNLNAVRAKSDSARRARELATKVAQAALKQTQSKLDSIAAITAEIATNQSKLADVTAKLAKLDPAETELEKAGLLAELATAKTKLTTLEADQREYVRAQADSVRNAQALLEHAKAQAKVEVLKAAIAAVEEIQGRMVAAAFGKILETVNRFTSVIIPEPIELRDGELGRYVGSTWVKVSASSVTQQNLIFAGVAAALAAQSPIRLIIMDDLGVADEVSIGLFLDRMVEMVQAGEIDQFVGAWSWVRDFDRCGVMTIALK